MSLRFGLSWERVCCTSRVLRSPGCLPFFPPGQTPQRVAWPGPVPESLNLDLLESMLRHFGANEGHKAIGLLLEILGPPPTGLHLQRYGAPGAPMWEFAGLCRALHPLSLTDALLPPL